MGNFLRVAETVDSPKRRGLSRWDGQADAGDQTDVRETGPESSDGDGPPVWADGDPGPASFECVEQFQPIRQWRIGSSLPFDVASLAAGTFEELPVASDLLGVNVALHAVFARRRPSISALAPKDPLRVVIPGRSTAAPPSRRCLSASDKAEALIGGSPDPPFCGIQSQRRGDVLLHRSQVGKIFGRSAAREASMLTIRPPRAPDAAGGLLEKETAQGILPRGVGVGKQVADVHLPRWLRHGVGDRMGQDIGIRVAQQIPPGGSPPRGPASRPSTSGWTSCPIPTCTMRTD